MHDDGRISLFECSHTLGAGLMIDTYVSRSNRTGVWQALKTGKIFAAIFAFAILGLGLAGCTTSPQVSTHGTARSTPQAAAASGTTSPQVSANGTARSTPRAAAASGTTSPQGSANGTDNNSSGLASYPGPEHAYYVSPNGTDNNSGTLDSPWKTLAYALTKLSPSDVLYLRGGTYYEHGLTASLKGTATAPITIQSYPGEHALIDGGMPDFKDTSNAEWELVDDRIHLYRSKRTFSGSFVRAWLVDDDVQLVEYKAKENMESTNYDSLHGMEPFYMGPGVHLRDDGHIYIRLQYNPNDLADWSGEPLAPIPADTDPNHNKIAVFTSDHIFLLDDAEYLHFKDLDFSYAVKIMDVRNGSHHIELDGCRLNYGSYGLAIHDGSHDWEIHNCEFNNGLPDYVYWTDVKNKDQEVAEAYPEFQSEAITGSIPSFNIHHNVFRNSFDALLVKDGTIDARITENMFKHIRDDAINLTKGISNVEVAHNMLWHVRSGISNLGSDVNPGQIYIHHNVIDNSAYQRGGRPGNYRANDWPIWSTGAPFSSHDNGNKASWWKLYNNTIITRRSGYEWDAAGPTTVTGNSEKYVYNNIFYVIDDRVVYRADLASSGSHYDGNVIYRNAPGRFPLLLHFGDGSDYNSLADFRERSGTDWEVNGLEIDPGFSISVIEDPKFDPATIWERYRPTNSQVFAAGASYSGLNWPGTEGVNYRGAVSPTS